MYNDNFICVTLQKGTTEDKKAVLNNRRHCES